MGHKREGIAIHSHKSLSHRTLDQEGYAFVQAIPSPNNLRIAAHWHLTWRVLNASFAHSLNVSSGSANNEESSARRFDVLPQTWSESCKKIRAAIDRFCASADNPGLVLCQGNLAGEQPLQKTLRVAVDESATV